MCGCAAASPLAYAVCSCGLPYSTIVETDPKDGVTYDILYDILIKQTGDIHSDWDGTPLDVDAYGKAVFEPYDLKWLTRST